LSQYSLAAIDIGNSNISIGYFLEGQLIRQETRKTKYLKSSFKLKDSLNIIISSVVPRTTEIILSKYPLSIVVSLKDVGIKFPNNIGVDRAINCFSAQKLYKTKNVLVVDFGTALTFTCCAHQDFRGGIIMAGYGLAKRSLSQNAVMLPGVEGIANLDIFQKETQPAILSGVLNFYKQAVSGLIDKYTAAIGKDLVVVLTGGDSLLFVDVIDNYNVVNPTLLLEGLASLAK